MKSCSNERDRGKRKRSFPENRIRGEEPSAKRMAIPVFRTREEYFDEMDQCDHYLFKLSRQIQPNLSVVCHEFSNLNGLVCSGAHLFREWVKRFRPFEQSQKVAFILYNCGIIVKKIGKPIDFLELPSRLIMFLLELVSTLQPTSKSLSNILYGIGLLGKSHAITGTIDSESLVFSFEKLLILEDVNVQKISNSFYGLGFLAQNKNILGSIDAVVLWRALKKLLTFEEIKPQAIANSLYGLGLLSQSKNIIGAINTAILGGALDKLLTLGDLKAPDNLKPQHIANSFYGLGFLSQNKNITGAINIAVLDRALEKLLTLDDLKTSDSLKPQDIGNSLYGAGLIAQSQKLTGIIDANALNKVFDKQLILEGVNAQNIGNSLYGLGFLAQNKNITGVLDISVLSESIDKLLTLKGLQPQNIGNSFYGLGFLAQSKNIIGAIKAEVLNEALKKLLTLDNLNTSDSTKSQHIANSLYGLGFLSQGKNIIGTVKAVVLNRALDKLLTLEDVNAQAIANSLYGLGFLARNKSIAETIGTLTLVAALKKLLTLGRLQPQHIANSFYGLGLLSQSENIIGTVEAEIFNEALEKLLSLKGVKAQAIANSLYGLGLLAQSQKLSGTIDISLLNKALGELLILESVNAQSIANIFLSLSLLDISAQSSERPFSEKLKILAKELLACNSLLIDFIQILKPWTTLIDPSDKEGFKLFLKLANYAVEFYHLTPTHVAQLLTSLSDYRAHYRESEELEVLYQALLPSMSIPLRYFPPSIQESLNNCLTRLEEDSNWHTDLSNNLASFEENNTPILEREEEVREEASSGNILPQRIAVQPTRRSRRAPQVVVTEWSERVRRNGLFSAIARKDEGALKELLGLLGAGSPKPTDNATGRNKKTRYSQGGSRTSQTKESVSYALVHQFFNELPASELRTLIRQSKARFFRWLFQACTAHERYQLCQSSAVYVLWQNLPLAELKDLIEIMISPFAIYRDHRALLRVIDALTIRGAQVTGEERNKIVELQERLLTRGIRFHVDCKHTHVISCLGNVLDKIISNNESILDLVEEERLESVSLAEAVTNDFSSSIEDESDVAMEIVNIQPARVFQPSAPNSRHRSNGNYAPNINYFYEAEDLIRILTYRMDELKDNDVVCLAAVELRGQERSDIASILYNWLSGAPLANAKVFIPIHDSNHWTGIRIDFQAGNIVRLFYFDGYLSERSKDRQIDILHHRLESVGLISRSLGIECVNTSIRQTDGSSCGALMIENFYCHLTDKTWRGKDIESRVRQRHLNLLERVDNEFFHEFGQRQERNQATVPSMSIQYKTHGIRRPD